MSPADSIIPLNGKYPLKVSLGAHRGRIVVDLRYQYLAKEEGDRLKPTRRGVTINAVALPEILTALNQIHRQMINDGVLEYVDEGSPPKFRPEIYPKDF
jgi:hypothetical protein